MIKHFILTGFDVAHVHFHKFKGEDCMDIRTEAPMLVVSWYDTEDPLSMEVYEEFKKRGYVLEELKSMDSDYVEERMSYHAAILKAADEFDNRHGECTPV